MAVGKTAAKVQYLLDVADADLSEAIDNSVLAQIMAKGGDVSDYSNLTDSLEALSDALAAIPTTAERGTDSAFLAAIGGALNDAAATGAVSDAKTMMGYIKQLVTAIQLIPTTAMRGTDGAALATVLGALNDSAAEGAVTNADTAMAYLKQLVTAVALIPTTAERGTDNAALATTLEGAMQKATGPAYSQDTDSLEAISEAVAAIPTTAMRGTDNAALASVLGALNNAAAADAVTDTDTAMAYIKQLVTAGIARDLVIADLVTETETIENHLHPDLSVTTPNGRLRVGAMTFVDVAANTETVTLGKTGGASRIYTFKTNVDTPAAGNVTIKVQGTQALSAQMFAKAVNGTVDAVNIGYGDSPTAHPDFACSYTGQQVSIGSVAHTGSTVVVIAKIGDSLAVCTFTNTLTNEVLTAITRIYTQRYVLAGNAAALIDRIAGAYQCICPMNSVFHPTENVLCKYDVGKIVVEGISDDSLVVECDGYYSTDEVTFVPMWYGLEVSKTPKADGSQMFPVNSHMIPKGAGFYVKMRSSGTNAASWIDFKAQYHVYPSSL